MSAEQDVVYSQNLRLYTLKGDVTVTFLDGQSFTGRIVKQDMFNLFFLVEGEVRMVSRSQVWYVSAISYSQIDEDVESMPVAHQANAPSPPRREDVSTVQPGVVVPPELVAEPAPEPPPNEEDYAFATELELDAASVEMEPEAPGPEPTMLDFEAPQTELDFPVPDFDFEPDEENGDTAVLQPGRQEEEEITYILPDQDEADDAGLVSGAARIVCSGGPHVGESWEISGDVVTVGRASYNNIPLSLDKEVSRNHAIIRHEAGQFSIEDQDSLNGVFVNQERISTSRVLHNGDIILIGVSTLEFVRD